ncbi:two-component system, sensor histidine kinase YesM [Lachnospiraceae bacterium]|nr:two-component system, sensor histidine kinase YesM [Lachnospiraceae bacterium]
MTKQKIRKKSKIQSKLIAYIWICVIPLIVLFGVAVIRLYRYYQDYDLLVRNITSANSYNMKFKDNMDETMYRIITGSANWSDPEKKLVDEDPIAYIEEAKGHFVLLREKTTEENVRSDLEALIKLMGILEERTNDILENVEEGGHYDENMEMLDMNIRTLTSLIQDDIQKYIYDEASNMEKLRIQVAKSLLSTVRWLVIFLIVIIAFIYIISKRLSQRITEPITDLCEMTEKFAGGDFTVSYHTDRTDEMSTLAESFNSMVKEIETLIDDIHKEQENAKDAELRLLQEQINPHFLYNTLDAIIWMTESGENQKAIQVIQELSSFFRISLSKGQSEITINNEKEHVKSYLEIQRYRYQDIMDYELHFDEDILDYHIQKLTLQPIVENALYHGIKNKRGKGLIEVYGMKDGSDIVFKVKDNGIGMNEEELERLRKLISNVDAAVYDSEKSGFGMANVEKRIEMLYGRGYGMKVDSTYMEGTTVTVRIPQK